VRTTPTSSIDFRSKKNENSLKPTSTTVDLKCTTPKKIQNPPKEQSTQKEEHQNDEFRLKFQEMTSLLKEQVAQMKELKGMILEIREELKQQSIHPPHKVQHNSNHSISCMSSNYRSSSPPRKKQRKQQASPPNSLWMTNEDDYLFTEI
jgi:aspartokinase